MHDRVRIACRFTVALLLASFLAACSDDDGGSRSDPLDAVPVDETITLPGLPAASDVVTDSRGIAHIYAPDQLSAVFLQGYETARSRFWEMDAFRRLSTGRLSEIFGTNLTLGTDAEMRTIFTTRDGRRLEAALWERVLAEDPDLAALVEAYANGVNAWLDDVRADRNGATIPAEYSFVGAGIEDLTNWHPSDTIIIGRLQQWNLSFDASEEIARAERMTALDQPLFDDVYRSAPASPATILPVGATTAASRPDRGTLLSQLPPLEVLASVRRSLEQVAAANPVTRGSEFVGSNNWIVSPQQSASGHALLANDPHLAHFNPPIWHMVQLETDDGFMVNGVNFPGLSGIVLGHNAHGAWGATTSNMDVTDVYYETVTTPDDYPQSPRTVLFKGDQVPIRRIVERIRSNDGTAVDLVIEIVPHHGPMMPDPDLGDEVEGIAATGMSVRWTGHEVSLDAVFLMKLNQARNVGEFREALRFYATGGQNWIWADIDGDIAYSANVLIPQRPAGAVPYLPMPGTGEAEWLTDADGNTLWLSEDQIPHSLNPAEGYLASANNDHNGNTLDNDPLNDEVYLTYTNAVGFRQQRILDLLSNDAGVRPEGAKMTTADMSAYQYDHVSLEASRLVPWLLQAAEARVDLVTADMQDALDRLRSWGEPRDDSPAWNMLSGVEGADLRDDLAPRAEPVSSEEHVDAIATSIYVGWATRLARTVFADDFAGTGVGSPGGSDATKALLHILEDVDRTDPGFVVHTKGPDGQSTLWDDKNTPAVETRDEILLAALSAGLEFLASDTAFGSSNPEDWLWGLIHQARFQHFFGQSGLPLYDLGNFAAPGGNYTVNPGGYNLNSDRFVFTGGPSMRFVVELDPDGIRAVQSLPGGNFGNPGELTTEKYNTINPSLHYGDLTAAYINGEPFELPITRQAVAADAERRVHFEPAPTD
jgi:penicillin amidase